VLEAVHERMRGVFLSRLHDGMPAGTAVDALLTAAREDPDGFRLLWRHSAREPQFAAYSEEVRDRAVVAARVLLGTFLPENTLEWAAHTVVAFLVEATLNWLDYGDAGRDDEYARLTAESLRSLAAAWSGASTGG
jgi:hypothetical protein